MIDSGCRYLSQLPALLIGYQNLQSSRPAFPAVHIYHLRPYTIQAYKLPTRRFRVYLVSPPQLSCALVDEAIDAA